MLQTNLYLQTMEEINYKEQDRKAILDYLSKKKGEVDVPVLMAESGANRLRVYNLLWELEHDGTIVVTRQTELGTPEAVELKNQRV